MWIQKWGRENVFTVYESPRNWAEKFMSHRSWLAIPIRREIGDRLPLRSLFHPFYYLLPFANANAWKIFSEPSTTFIKHYKTVNFKVTALSYFSINLSKMCRKYLKLKQKNKQKKTGTQLFLGVKNLGIRKFPIKNRNMFQYSEDIPSSSRGSFLNRPVRYDIFLTV